MPAALSEVTVKTALTPTGGFLYSYTHTLTPYWGCPYGCFYCYVGESPVLPHHPERFANLLAASSCQRVIVDSLIDGDGAQGTRSQRRGAPELLARYGWADWFGRERALALYQALVQRMGEDRVGYSKAGFNQFLS